MAVDAAPPLLTFFQAVLLGLSAGLVYDLLRALRLRLPRLTAPLDILYCLTAGAAAFLFILRRAQGQLRVYMLPGRCRRACGCSFGSWPGRCGRCGTSGWIPWLFCCIWRPFLRRERRQSVKKLADTEKISFILSGNAIQ